MKTVGHSRSRKHWKRCRNMELKCRAMKKYPATMDKGERWKKIAEEVPGKTKIECVKRVKWIREEMLKRK